MCCPYKAGPLFEGVLAVILTSPRHFHWTSRTPVSTQKLQEPKCAKANPLLCIWYPYPLHYLTITEFWWWGGKQEEMAGTIKQETVFNIEKKLCIWKLLAPNCQNKKNSLSFYNTHPSPQFCGKSYQHKDTAMPFTCWKVFPNFNVKAVRV